MQENKLKLQSLKVGCIPIIDKIIDRMDLHNILNAALKNRDYSDSLLILLKNILIDRDALYAVKDWAGTFNLRLSSGSKINDDRLGRSLDRLFEGDRSTLQTQVVLSMVKTC